MKKAKQQVVTAPVVVEEVTMTIKEVNAAMSKILREAVNPNFELHELSHARSKLAIAAAGKLIAGSIAQVVYAKHHGRTKKIDFLE